MIHSVYTIKVCKYTRQVIIITIQYSMVIFAVRCVCVCVIICIKKIYIYMYICRIERVHLLFSETVVERVEFIYLYIYTSSSKAPRQTFHVTAAVATIDP